MKYVELNENGLVVARHDIDIPLEGEHFIEVSEDQFSNFVQTRNYDWYYRNGVFERAAQPNDLPSAAELCRDVDIAADKARAKVAGDPLRAVEYDRAAREAEAFAAAGYQGEVPPMVAAWAINGRTAQQAADDILREAAQYNGALVQLRTTRLQAKELIRQAMANGNVEQAQNIAAATIAAIEAAVAGIGNNSAG